LDAPIDIVASNYCLRAGYSSRPEPQYFKDEESGYLWQPDVYEEAREIARRLAAARIVDVGCGEAQKLVKLSPELELVGIDFGTNLEICRTLYPFGTWIDHDLERADPLPLASAQWRRSVIVCADVVEHLIHPERLLAQLRSALQLAEALVLTTPERELTWGESHLGPPPNPCHVREWSRSEFATLLQTAGFDYFDVGLTRSSEKDPLLRTIFALCCPTRRILDRVRSRH
jgi:hypothetical protein